MDTDAGVRGWIYNTARKNYWRVPPWYDLDDLVQDGYWHYARIVTRYSDVKSRAHMMALFKRTYLNHINDLSKKATKYPQINAGDLVERSPGLFSENAFWDCIMWDEGNMDWAGLAAMAPEPIRDVFRLLSSDDGIRRLRSHYRIRRDGTRETFNERLCRLIGIEPTFDLAGALRSYLTKV